jgi:hypothetical protein
MRARAAISPKASLKPLAGFVGIMKFGAGKVRHEKSPTRSISTYGAYYVKVIIPRNFKHR